MHTEQMRQRRRARLWWTALNVLRGKTRRARAILERLCQKISKRYENLVLCTWFIAIKGVVGLHDFTSCQNAAYSNKVVSICWVDYALEGSAFY